MKYKEENIKLKRQIEQLKVQIDTYRYDQLTNLMLRRDFENDFTALFENKIEFNLTLIDVNGLHLINKIGGYHAGDDLIVSVAEEIKKRTKGDIYRVGGDEFAIISLETINCSACNNFVSASVHSANYETTVEMFKAADKLVSEAKVIFYQTTGKERRT